MPQPQVSVVLCVRNGGHLLARQLDALSAQRTSLTWELIVVDNLSTDRSADVATSYADRLPDLRVLPATERASLAYARNIGAGHARGRMLAFCDADDEADPRWLEELVAACPPGGIVGGQLDFRRLNSDEQRYWRGYGNHLPGLTVIGSHLPFAVGANFACDRGAYLSVDGCDPQFVAAFDDVDLSWRMQHEGRRLAFAPDAVMHYRLRSTIRSTCRQQYGYGQAEVALYVKHSRWFAPEPVRAAVGTYRMLVRQIPSLLTGRRERGRWSAVSAMRVGRARGSLRHRVCYL